MSKKRFITPSDQPKLANFFNNNESNKKLSKTSKNEVSTQPVICPVCNLTLWNDMCMNNLHIDGCLKRIAILESQQAHTVTTTCSSITLPHNIINSIQPLDSVPGLWIMYNFITEEEEINLINSIDRDNSSLWKHNSFNGHCTSKYYGFKFQFGLPKEIHMVRKNDVNSGEPDLPDYLRPFIERLQTIVSHRKDLPVEMRTFEPNECNVNNYIRADNAYLRPHFDDRTLSGPLLVNLSLCGFARMTYTLPTDSSVSISVELPRRSLQLVTGKARWNYMHEIKQHDILDPRRVSITWRQSGKKGSGVADKEVSKEHNIISQLNQQKGL